MYFFILFIYYMLHIYNKYIEYGLLIIQSQDKTKVACVCTYNILKKFKNYIHLPIY